SNDKKERPSDCSGVSLFKGGAVRLQAGPEGPDGPTFKPPQNHPGLPARLEVTVTSSAQAHRRRFGRELWRVSPAKVSFASIRPNDVVNPAPPPIDRGIDVRRTELTCRCTTLRAMQPPS